MNPTSSRTSVIILTILSAWLFLQFTGCENESKKSPLEEEIASLRREKKQLSFELGQSQADTQKLRGQLKVLMGLEDRVQPEEIQALDTVRLTKYTNLYDKDKDGRKEKLIVYIQPVDRNGDSIKAGGAVDVQLWDLNRQSGQALLGQWHIGPDELRKLWFTSMLASNYRLTFDVAEVVDKFESPLTVKATFTDYLTGKVFKEQKVIEPD